MLVFAPFFSNVAIPPRIKIGLLVAITVVLFPVYGSTLTRSLAAVNWVGVVIGESVIGAALGLVVGIAFEGAQLAGQIVGVQIGFSLASVMDPQTQADSPVLSIFCETITLLIFLQLNVHHWLIRGLASSFAYMPAGSVVPSFIFTSFVWHTVGGLWLAGLQIAAPALVATLVSDVVLGFLGKASPQFPVLLVGMSLKAIVGLAVCALAIASWPKLFERQFAFAVGAAEQALRLAR